MFDDFRTKLFKAYEDLHAASYPALLVNYPGIIVVDPEHQTDPFVVVGAVFSKTKQMDLGSRSVIIRGELLVHYYFRPGTGSKHAANFSDFLLDKISMRTISGIKFKELTPYPIKGEEGWEGTLNVVPFQTEYFNV